MCLSRRSLGSSEHDRDSQNFKRTTLNQTHSFLDGSQPFKLNIPDREQAYVIFGLHQGDLVGIKGLYRINAVDEVTKFQFIPAVEHISERFLLPILENLILAFPFTIRAFHADNASEYINHRVAKLYNKLQVEEFTKSRAHTSKVNALVQRTRSKNSSVVRKHLVYSQIPSR